MLETISFVLLSISVCCLWNQVLKLERNIKKLMSE